MKIRPADPDKAPSSAPRQSSLVDQILAGRNHGLMTLAAQGIVPLPREELVRVQVALAEHEDEEIAATSLDSLKALDRAFLVSHLRQDAGPDVLAYFARSEEAWIVETVLQRRDIAPQILQDLAPRVGADLQEILLLRQDMIVKHPELLEALSLNPNLSNFSKRKIDEYNHHLLGFREPVVEEPEPEGLAEALEELDEEEQGELTDAVEQVLQEVEAEGDLDSATGLSESQVRALASSIRAKLARGASRTLRAILIRDPNPQVATMVLRVSAITESEIEQISANRYVCEEVLTQVANRREWVAKYTVMHNLVKNARTPVGIAVKFVSRLSVRDLGLLRKDRNVPDAVRQTAIRLHRLKTQ